MVEPREQADNPASSANYLPRSRHSLGRELKKNRQLFLMLLVPVTYILIFHYVPMYGAQIAFKNFLAMKGIWGSPWVGLQHFENLFSSYQFTRILRNTLVISLYSLLAGFPVPIILALSLHNNAHVRLKKAVQMTTYAPHFISTVVMVGIILQFLSAKTGVANRIIEAFGGEAIVFLAEPGYFSSIYVWTEIWQHAGWGTIIYLAALSAIDPTLYEAAIVDGANKVRRILHIDLPGLAPTIVILLILDVGKIMSLGFEKVFLLQNTVNLEASEIIATYVYKVGLAGSIPRYSYGAAVGLFNAVINFFLLVSVNQVARRVSSTSLW